jgi:hypothetical protein
VGSLEPIALEPARIASELAAPAVQRDLVEFSWDPYPGAAQWRRLSVPPRDEDTRILTDDRPWLEFGLLQRLLARVRRQPPV